MKHVTSSQKEVGLGSQKTFNPISIVVFVLIGGFIALVLYIDELLAYEHIIPWSVSISGAILALLIAAAIKIADQWEKAVILRMGKFIGLKGPGLFFIIPILDRVDKYIDQRVRVTDFNAEKTLTKDTVPVDVDAGDGVDGGKGFVWGVDVNRAAIGRIGLEGGRRLRAIHLVDRHGHGF